MAKRFKTVHVSSPLHSSSIHIHQPLLTDSETPVPRTPSPLGPTVTPSPQQCSNLFPNLTYIMNELEAQEGSRLNVLNGEQCKQTRMRYNVMQKNMYVLDAISVI